MAVRRKNMRDLIRQYRGLPRPVYILFVSKIVDATGCFIWPLLALILTRKIGLSSAEAGIAVGVVMAACAVSPFLGGKLADVIGRKPSIAIFTGGAVVAYLICGLIPPSPTMLVFVILGIALLSAASPAHDALVADLVATERRQIAYSLLYLGWNIGFAAGPAIGGFLLEDHLGIMFIGDALTALAALIMVMLFVPEPRRPAAENTSPAPAEAEEKGSILAVLFGRPVLLLLGLILFGYNIAYGQWGFLLPLQLSEAFSDAGSRIFGLVASVNGVTVIIANPVFTLLFKRTPHLRVIFLGGLFYAIGFGLMGFAASEPLFFLLGFVFTLGEVALAISTMPYIMARTPASHRGRMGGVAQLFCTGGGVVGPIVVGVALQAISIKAAWITVGFIALAFSAIALILGRVEAMKKVPKAD
jgi:MFS family permease